MTRTLIIKGTKEQIRQDVYNFLVAGRFRQVIKVEQVKPNYIHLVYVPETKG